jgi:hypothetical protein
MLQRRLAIIDNAGSDFIDENGSGAAVEVAELAAYVYTQIVEQS